MTTIWQPQAQEPDLLTEAVFEAIRVAVFGVPPVGVAIAPVPGTPWLEAKLADGRVLRLGLTVSPAEHRMHGVRACIALRVTGEVALAGDGYRLAADLVVDGATRAILACEHRLERVGLDAFSRR